MTGWRVRYGSSAPATIAVLIQILRAAVFRCVQRCDLMPNGHINLNSSAPPSDTTGQRKAGVSLGSPSTLVLTCLSPVGTIFCCALPSTK